MLVSDRADARRREVAEGLRPRPQARSPRVALHSRRQVQLASSELGIPAGKLAFVPYFADTSFWLPRAADAGEPLVLSVGREHRDFATLARACEGLPARVFVA